ncbi:DUF655 domain-containing protein [Nanoarchaeota archaeon]|nr:MAG: DUF655 domain-containing protein [Nanoarchaeota archaeon]
MIKNIKKEEYVIVLDFLPHGHINEGKPQPIAQVIGKEMFTLLEVTPKKGVFLKPGEEVYIGPGKREKVHHILGRIRYDKLTNMAKSELESVVEKLVSQKEDQFVRFFNEAKGITSRLHEFEVLPGIGRKHMWDLIKERESAPFKSFEDIKQRVKLIPDVKKVIIKRIIEELQDKDRHKIFTQ